MKAILIILIGLLSATAEAKTQPPEIGKLVVQLVEKLEQVPYSDWKIEPNEITITRGHYEISISKSGFLYVNSSPISTSYNLSCRLEKLYNKVVFKDLINWLKNIIQAI